MVEEGALARMIVKLMKDYGLFINPKCCEDVLSEIDNLLINHDTVEFFSLNRLNDYKSSDVQLIWFGREKTSPRVTITLPKHFFLSTREPIRGYEDGMV